MDYYLIALIAIAVCLHLAEHFIRKCRKLLAVMNVLFHVASFFAFVLLGRELTDVFVFFLSSAICSPGLMLKEVKEGI